MAFQPKDRIQGPKSNCESIASIIQEIYLNFRAKNLIVITFETSAPSKECKPERIRSSALRQTTFLLRNSIIEALVSKKAQFGLKMDFNAF